VRRTAAKKPKNRGGTAWHATCTGLEHGGSGVSANDRELGAYRRLARSRALLDAERERALLRHAKEGDAGATRELVECHMRLVVQVASAYARDGISVHDLVGEGVLGLMEAVRRFDLEQPVRFASYAAWWVRACVGRHALANRRIVGMPDTRAARLARTRLRGTERALSQELGRKPACDELAAALGISEADVEQVDAALSGRDVVLVHDGSTSSFEPPDEHDGPEQAVANAESEAQRTRDVQYALAGLDPRERAIVCEHLYTEHAASLTELGRSLGMSRQRAGQILAGACEKLRTELSRVA
jgi:RNA polymerase sigma-32 factor